MPRKRQFRIRESRLEFMFDSNVHVMDELLQEELSRSADDRMKSIVATIQRDQNAVIRDERATVLIIQGVQAPARHRLRCTASPTCYTASKDSLTSSDILIISPNRVFADYVGNVLPELGERAVMQVTEQVGSPYTWHSGDLPGFSTDMARVPARHEVVVILSNRSGADVRGLARQM